MSATREQADATIRLCQGAAEKSWQCGHRHGNVVELGVEAGDDIFVAADLHGNRLNFRRLCELADLEHNPRRHLIMQEVCHGGPSYPDGGCMSHLLLEDVARLQARFPDRFHFLLSNHELAELLDYPISKGKKMLNLSFRCGIQEMYGSAAEEVRHAYQQYISSCPLAVRLPHGVFISHSLPERVDKDGFDVDVLQRRLTGADLKACGPAFRLVWGRDYRVANAEAFAKLIGAELLIHGHEPCPEGCRMPNQRQVIIDCCGDRGAFLHLPIGPKLTHRDVMSCVRSIFPRPSQSAVVAPALAATAKKSV